MVNKECAYCGKDFWVYQYRADSAKCCCQDCYHKASRKTEVRKCLNCGAEFVVTPCDEKKFCGNECACEYKRNRPKMPTQNQNGYLVVWQTDGSGKLQHRKIMEQMLGRKLGRDEVVHHIDGNRSNNDISNLVVLSRSEHSALHRAQEKAKGKHFFGRKAVRNG